MPTMATMFSMTTGKNCSLPCRNWALNGQSVSDMICRLLRKQRRLPDVSRISMRRSASIRKTCMSIRKKACRRLQTCWILKRSSQSVRSGWTITGRKCRPNYRKKRLSGSWNWQENAVSRLLSTQEKQLPIRWKSFRTLPMYAVCCIVFPVRLRRQKLSPAGDSISVLPAF